MRREQETHPSSLSHDPGGMKVGFLCDAMFQGRRDGAGELPRSPGSPCRVFWAKGPRWLLCSWLVHKASWEKLGEAPPLSYLSLAALPIAPFVHLSFSVPHLPSSPGTLHLLRASQFLGKVPSALFLTMTPPGSPPSL